MISQLTAQFTRLPQIDFGWEKLKKKYLKFKMNSFEPKVKFSFEFKNYTVKTVDTTAELWEVLKLRYDIFTEKYGVGMNYDIDFNRLDLLGDHIILVHKPNNKVIGTYRVICSRFSNEFYSEAEFDIVLLKSSPGVKLELGRACIHSDYRNGASISLIWRGLSKYMLMVEADYLFGCTSVHTTDYV